MPLISVNDGGFFERDGYWDEAPEEVRDPQTVCPRCDREKHPENAVCDDCGDVVGCACCGGTGCDECDDAFLVGANYD